jgi:hypothetical protein
MTPWHVRCENCSLYWPDHATMTKCINLNKITHDKVVVLCDHCMYAADYKRYRECLKLRAERLRQRAALYPNGTPQ